MKFIDLEFLTSDKQLIELCSQYWSCNDDLIFAYKVTDLAKKFGTNTRNLKEIVNTYSKAHSSEIICVDCGSKYIFKSRSEFQQRFHLKTPKWQCTDCKAKEEHENKRKQTQLDEEKRQTIRERYDLSNREAISLEDISFENAVCFLSAVRIGATENLAAVLPFQLAKGRFAPTEEMHYAIVKQLYHDGLLYVHPESSPEAFIFTDGIPNQFYLDAVMWGLPISETSLDPRELINELEIIFLNMDWPDHWYEERIPFWRKLALQECLQYLYFTLEQHGFSFQPGEKTQLVFNNLLEDHSVAQAYNFIWRAAKDAAAFYVREKVSKQHAANTVIGSIQRYVERARAEGWETKPYRRDFRCPESMVSHTLYNTVLHIGDEGFSGVIK